MAVRKLTRSSIRDNVWYRSMLAGNIFAFGAYELIATTVLSSNQSSVTFSSLGDYAATYQHLQIRVVGRGSSTKATQLSVNSDTTDANYYGHYLYRNQNGELGSGYDDTRFIFELAGPDSTANAFGVAILDILDPFESTKNTTFRVLYGEGTFIVLSSSVWFNTASITSISFVPYNGNFVTGSRFSLYGLR